MVKKLASIREVETFLLLDDDFSEQTSKFWFVNQTAQKSQQYTICWKYHGQLYYELKIIKSDFIKWKIVNI